MKDTEGADNPMTPAEAEAAARVCLVKYGKTRLFFSRLFERFLTLVQHFTRQGTVDPIGQVRTILVIEYWYLGDFVMATPFLRNLRVHFPEARIAIVASPRIIPVLEGQGLVDEIIPLNAPWAQAMSRRKKYLSRYWLEYFECIASIRRRGFDLGFVVRADIRDNFMLWLGRVSHRVGFGYGYGHSMLTHVVKPNLSLPHYSDRWLQLLESLGKPILDRRPHLQMDPNDRTRAKSFLDKLGINDADMIIGIHAGARNPIRNWGDSRFLEVAKRLSREFAVKILWFHEPGSPGPRDNSFLFPVALPLREFLAVLSHCKLLLCNDTGPMHMAAAYGIPVVAVFGPGEKTWWGPRSDNSRVVARDGVWCRPCFDYCIFDQPYCLRAISVEEVYDAASEAILVLTNETSKKLRHREPACPGKVSGTEQAAD